MCRKHLRRATGQNSADPSLNHRVDKWKSDNTTPASGLHTRRRVTSCGRQQRFPTFAESCLWKCEAVRANGGLRVSLRTHTIGQDRSYEFSEAAIGNRGNRMLESSRCIWLKAPLFNLAPCPVGAGGSSRSASPTPNLSAGCWKMSALLTHFVERPISITLDDGRRLESAAGNLLDGQD